MVSQYVVTGSQTTFAVETTNNNKTAVSIPMFQGQHPEHYHLANIYKHKKTYSKVFLWSLVGGTTATLIGLRSSRISSSSPRLLLEHRSLPLLLQLVLPSELGGVASWLLQAVVAAATAARTSDRPSFPQRL